MQWWEPVCVLFFQNPGQSVAAATAATAATAPGYVFAAIPHSPDLMYAQPPPQPTFQHTDITEATTMLEAPPLEVIRSPFTMW